MPLKVRSGQQVSECLSQWQCRELASSSNKSSCFALGTLPGDQRHMRAALPPGQTKMHDAQPLPFCITHSSLSLASLHWCWQWQHALLPSKSGLFQQNYLEEYPRPKYSGGEIHWTATIFGAPPLCPGSKNNHWHDWAPTCSGSVLSHLNTVSFSPHSDPERGAVIPVFQVKNLGIRKELIYLRSQGHGITRSQDPEGSVHTVFSGNVAPGGVQCTQQCWPTQKPGASLHGFYPLAVPTFEPGQTSWGRMRRQGAASTAGPCGAEPRAWPLQKRLEPFGLVWGLPGEKVSDLRWRLILLHFTLTYGSSQCYE